MHLDNKDINNLLFISNNNTSYNYNSFNINHNLLLFNDDKLDYKFIKSKHNNKQYHIITNKEQLNYKFKNLDNIKISLKTIINFNNSICINNDISNTLNNVNSILYNLKIKNGIDIKYNQYKLKEKHFKNKLSYKLFIHIIDKIVIEISKYYRYSIDFYYLFLKLIHINYKKEGIINFDYVFSKMQNIFIICFKKDNFESINTKLLDNTLSCIICNVIYKLIKESKTYKKYNNIEFSNLIRNILDKYEILINISKDTQNYNNRNIKTIEIGIYNQFSIKDDSVFNQSRFLRYFNDSRKLLKISLTTDLNYGKAIKKSIHGNTNYTKLINQLEKSYTNITNNFDNLELLIKANIDIKYLYNIFNAKINIIGFTYSFFFITTNALKNLNIFFYEESNKQEIYSMYINLNIFNILLSESKIFKIINRLSLNFTNTFELELDKDILIEYINDYNKTGRNRCFTDGCGLISYNLIKKLIDSKIKKDKNRCELSNYLDIKIKSDIFNLILEHNLYPSALQIRYLGCKGMLYCCSEFYNFENNKEEVVKLNDNTIYITKSMVKYNYNIDNNNNNSNNNNKLENKLEIHSMSGYSTGKINYQILLALGLKGINLHDLVLKISSKKLSFSFKFAKIKKLVKIIHKKLYNFDSLLDNSIDNCKDIINNLHILHDKLNRNYLYKYLYLTKFKFKVSNSALLYGVPDFTRTLKKNEVYLNIKKQFKNSNKLQEYNIACLYKSKTALLNNNRLCTYALLTKNPCTSINDIRLVKCVYSKELKNKFKNVNNLIVFNVHDFNPLSYKIANSDYDGDQYFISWNRSIVNCMIENKNKSNLNNYYILKNKKLFLTKNVNMFYSEYLIKSSIERYIDKHKYSFEYDLNDNTKISLLNFNSNILQNVSNSNIKQIIDNIIYKFKLAFIYYVCNNFKLSYVVKFLENNQLYFKQSNTNKYCIYAQEALSYLHNILIDFQKTGVTVCYNSIVDIFNKYKVYENIDLFFIQSSDNLDIKDKALYNNTYNNIQFYNINHRYMKYGYDNQCNIFMFIINYKLFYDTICSFSICICDEELPSFVEIFFFMYNEYVSNINNDIFNSILSKFLKFYCIHNYENNSDLNIDFIKNNNSFEKHYYNNTNNILKELSIEDNISDLNNNNYNYNCFIDSDYKHTLNNYKNDNSNYKYCNVFDCLIQVKQKFIQFPCLEFFNYKLLDLSFKLKFYNSYNSNCLFKNNFMYKYNINKVNFAIINYQNKLKDIMIENNITFIEELLLNISNLKIYGNSLKLNDIKTNIINKISLIKSFLKNIINKELLNEPSINKENALFLLNYLVYNTTYSKMFNDNTNNLSYLKYIISNNYLLSIKDINIILLNGLLEEIKYSSLIRNYFNKLLFIEVEFAVSY